MGNRIIAVANEKGGVGKTVTVINLGAALSQQGKTTLIVDMDPQFHATKGLGVKVDDNMLTVYDIIKDVETTSASDAITHTQWKGLDLIPSHVDLCGADIEMVDEDGRENKLKEALEDVVEKYDFVFLDTPPSLSLLTVNVFACASEVIVPCQTHPYAFESLNELFETIDGIKKDINPDINITGVVATMFDKRTNVCKNIMEKLKQNEKYNKLLFDTVIRTNATIAESSGVGKPVVFYKKSSHGASDYQNLATELISRKP